MTALQTEKAYLVYFVYYSTNISMTVFAHDEDEAERRAVEIAVEEIGDGARKYQSVEIHEEDYL